jgi:hypothetical protein
MMSAYIVELALSTIKTWLFGGALLAFVIGGVAYQQHREAKAEAHRQWLVQIEKDRVAFCREYQLTKGLCSYPY